MRAFNIKAKKRDLGKAKREIRKKVAELKEVNGVAQFLKEVIHIAQFFWDAILQARSTEYSTSKEMQENINKTFQDLELTAKVIGSLKQWMNEWTFKWMQEWIRLIRICNVQAHTFSEWCQECGCIHLDEVKISLWRLQVFYQFKVSDGTKRKVDLKQRWAMTKRNRKADII